MATAMTEAASPPTSGQRLVLYDVGWDSYRKISEALAGRHVRLTYDRGTLEFMTISPLHGHLSRLIARLIVVLTEELGLPLKSFGDMTCDRADLDRGLEPDECFYITHEPQVRSKDALDLTTDPPPDLAVEVDLTRGLRGRLAVYAALGVPEVWRYDGQTLTAHVLNESGDYEPTPESRCIPGLTVADLTPTLTRRGETDENTLIRDFRQWIRERFGSSS